MDKLPQDPFMLFSYVNTQLRDVYSSLDEFCKATDVDRDWLEKKLNDAGFEYSEELNKFCNKKTFNIMDYKTLRKRALIFDFVAIAVAGAVLYAGQSLLVPSWVLVFGALISVGALVLALKFSFAARKLAREEFARVVKEMKLQQIDKEEKK